MKGDNWPAVVKYFQGMAEVTGKEPLLHRLFEALRLMPVHYIYDSNAKAMLRMEERKGLCKGLCRFTTRWKATTFLGCTQATERCDQKAPRLLAIARQDSKPRNHPVSFFV